MSKLLILDKLAYQSFESILGGWFFMEYSSKCRPIYLKASSVMKLNETQKNISGSKSFSVYTLMKIRNRGKFHQHSICGC